MSLQAMHTAATGMIAQSQNLEVISNNLANVSTDGFKKARANFEDLLYKTRKPPGAGEQGNDATPSVGLQFGVGTRVSATQLNFQTGTIRPTGRPLDMAIIGAGFLQVNDDQGNPLYTRAGNLTLNPNGQVVLATSSRGLIVQPPVTVPADATSVSIGADGQVAITQAGNSTPQVIGNSTRSGFKIPRGCSKWGKTCFWNRALREPPSKGTLTRMDLAELPKALWNRPTWSPWKS